MENPAETKKRKAREPRKAEKAKTLEYRAWARLRKPRGIPLRWKTANIKVWEREGKAEE